MYGPINYDRCALVLASILSTAIIVPFLIWMAS
jgi:hypothetical protein